MTAPVARTAASFRATYRLSGIVLPLDVRGIALPLPVGRYELGPAAERVGLANDALDGAVRRRVHRGALQRHLTEQGTGLVLQVRHLGIQAGLDWRRGVRRLGYLTHGPSLSLVWP